jgi:3-oxoacyl-[acyl-carrier-protein] synthase I
MTPPLAIQGFGAVTAVGFDAVQTCAAVRAGLSGYRAAGLYLHRPTLTPVVAAPAPYETPSRVEAPVDRLARLAADAVVECATQAGVDPAHTPVILGVRESVEREIGARGMRHLLAQVAKAGGVQVHSSSAVLADGNCAIATGLLHAARLLASRTADCCIVGGVDSYLNDADIARYDRVSRIKTTGNARGFIPGEGAAVLAVARHDGRPTARALVLGVGLAKEDPAHIVLSDGHATGRALQAALAAATRDAGIEEHVLNFRVADLNGERYGGQESILASHRFYRTYRPALPVILPASRVGEIGAAAGALGLMIAAVSLIKGYASGNVAMCEASSEAGLRSGIVVAGQPRRAGAAGRPVETR